MEIVLLQRVNKLGAIGDVVNVKPGYAKNYLLPKKKALRATKENMVSFQEKKKYIIEENDKKSKEARDLASILEGQCFYIVRTASEAGHLYGSVRGLDIVSSLEAKGYSVPKQSVHIQHPIKSIGMHTVSLRLHPEVEVSIQVSIAQSEEEALLQNKSS